MATNEFKGDWASALKRISIFGVCYWTAATVQVVGSFSVFGTVGGSVLHAIAGALCLELMILALNAYGGKQSGLWMVVICATSLFLISASAMFQVAELLSHEPNAELVKRLGASYYNIVRATVPVVPSVAMALVTLIKFVDARRNQGVPLAEQLAATEHKLQQVNANLAGVVEQNREVLQANERLQHERETLQAQLDAQQVQHEAELREVARLATAQREPKVAQPAKQLSSGDVMEWDEAVRFLTERNETPGPTRMAELTGLNKSTASRRLKAVTQ